MQNEKNLKDIIIDKLKLPAKYLKYKYVPLVRYKYIEDDEGNQIESTKYMPYCKVHYNVDKINDKIKTILFVK